MENLTLDSSLANDSPVTGGTLIFFGWAKNCWATGVRTINNASPPYRNNIWTYQSSHLTIQNNYIYGSSGYDLSYGIEVAFMSDDNLVANNLLQHTATAEIINSGTGNVFAYNFSVDNYYTANGSAPGWQQSDSYPSHQDGSYLNLFEGNVGAKMAADDIHGTSWMATAFRNYWTGRDGPFKTGSTMVVDIETYSRYYNLIGNVLGEPGYHNNYKDVPASPSDNTGCGSAGNRSILAALDLGWRPRLLFQRLAFPMTRRSPPPYTFGGITTPRQQRSGGAAIQATPYGPRFARSFPRFLLRCLRTLKQCLAAPRFPFPSISVLNLPGM